MLILDYQVDHLREVSLIHAGKWILRKWNACSVRIGEALECLQELGIDEEELKEQWRLQVTAQTRPLVRAVKMLGRREVQAILEFFDCSKSLRKEIKSVDKKIATVSGSDELQELLNTRHILERRHKDVNAQIDSRRKKLGVHEEARLKKLLDDKYLSLLMQARALKERLRFRLQTRKFEYERLDRASQRGAPNGKLTLHDYLNPS